MRTNPYPDEPTTSVPRSDFLPQKERMEDLQPRPAPPPAPRIVPVAEVMPEVDTGQEEARTIKYAIGKLSDFLQWFIAVLEGALILRFLLQWIGADPLNLFASMLYALTDIVLFPFSSIVSSSTSGHHTLEGSTLIAMGIYALVFWAIRRFLRILISSPEETAS